jgi:TPR repeat protein
MIDMDYVASEVQGMIAMLDASELPDVYNYLNGLQDENGAVDTAPLVIANTLMGLDKPTVFPEFLIGFVEDMYQLEIAEGNDDAMNDLGAQYYDGSRGFEQSFDKAVMYYKMAAAKGNRPAQENLGYCYYYGRDGKPDYEKAFHYFALGAFDGHLVSLYKIGDMYLNGLYVPKNEKEAFYIYAHCMDTMTQQAEGRVAGPVLLRLGGMFLDGIGTEEDAKSALVCFQKAESYLYDMVLDGSDMYRRSLSEAIDGQAKARKKLAEQLPEKSWNY